MFLAGDVGATKILLEVGELRSGRWQMMFSRRYATHDEIDFPGTLREFLAEWDPKQPPGHGFKAAAFGVAGALEGNRVKMTRRPWIVDGDWIADRFAIPKVRVVNDLAAAAHGVDWLGPDELEVIQPGTEVPDAPRVVIGVGTGLGVSHSIRVGGHAHEVPGEGGHANFAPATVAQIALWNSIHGALGRVSNEDVLSGAGLERIYSHVNRRSSIAADPSTLPTAEAISTGAMDRGDPKCIEALDLFTECLGSVAGDFALSVLARGGVYLTGGVVNKILPWLKHEHFRAAFCAKAPFSALLMKVPITAVTSERSVVLGAARIASHDFAVGSF